MQPVEGGVRAEESRDGVRREVSGKEVWKKIRKEGRVPAIVEGGHREPVSITVDRKSGAELITRSEHGRRSIFLLKITGTDQQRHALIQYIQIAPISRKMLHIDFVRGRMEKVVKLNAPVLLSGLAHRVNRGGVLDWQSRDRHVGWLPTATPSSTV